MRIVIIGAGMAGLACAEGLIKGGHSVGLLDKGRGAGGRMATRRLQTSAGEAVFDHGAQYFTARDGAFKTRLDRWKDDGHVAAWPEAGPDAWVGVPAMNAPLRQMARGLDVQWGSRATALSRHEAGWIVEAEGGVHIGTDAVIVAIPAEQAAELTAIAAPAFSSIARGVASEPCWTVMAAFADRLATSADCLRGDDPDDALGWAARNRSKPERTGPETWVLQAGPQWSRDHIEASPDQIETLLLAALSERLEIPLAAPIAVSVHRWLYARPGTVGSDFLWDEAQKIGVCGDWFVGPRVEAAWMSGDALARHVVRPM